MFVDGDDQSNLTLMGFEHLGDGGVLGAEADAASEVEADARVILSGTRDDHGPDGAGATRVAGFNGTRELMSLGDEIAVSCGGGGSHSYLPRCRRRLGGFVDEVTHRGFLVTPRQLAKNKHDPQKYTKLHEIEVLNSSYFVSFRGSFRKRDISDRI
jgi:hypothetical protein